MAITKISKIKKTPHLALAYAMKDKEQEYFSEFEINENVPNKTWYDEETGKKYIKYFTLSSCLNCNPINPFEDFAERQKRFQGKLYKGSAKKYKDGLEPLMYHLKQSFNGMEVDYNTANEIGRKLAEELFSEYIVVVSTHGNTENIHNHIMISAWNENGRKLNYNKSLTNKIREVSDGLCEEYGLSVLENTRTMKLYDYTDRNGKQHSVEMTDRKRGLIEERREGFAAKDDVGSFRNSASYAERQRSKKRNLTDIREDIDMLLPRVKSYEELISELRKMGYTVNAKKKDGEWLSHVSFKAPHQSKATRDKSLSNDGFYERENLTMYIDRMREEAIEQEKNRRLRQQMTDKETDYPVVEQFDSYEYGKTDINKVNEKYRAAIDRKTGKIVTVERSECEQKTVRDLKKDYSILENDRRNSVADRKGIKLTLAEKERLIRRIVASWRCLSYCEKNNLYSYSQMFDLYRENKHKCAVASLKSRSLEEDIVTAKENAAVYTRFSELQKTIENHRGDFEYTLNHYPKDKQECAALFSVLASRGFETPEKQRDIVDRLSELTRQRNEYNDTIIDSQNQMNELENCIKTLVRIDSEAGFDMRGIKSEFDRLCGNVRTAKERER